jgi:hypothetical protein
MKNVPFDTHHQTNPQAHDFDLGASHHQLFQLPRTHAGSTPSRSYTNWTSPRGNSHPRVERWSVTTTTTDEKLSIAKKGRGFVWR